MSKILKIFVSYWWQIILLLGGLCLQVFSSLSLPDIMSDIINNGIGKSDMDYVWAEGFRMLGIVLIGMVGMVIAGFFASRIATGFAAKLREALFRHILSFSVDEIDRFSTASLITRTTNDITSLQQTLVMVLRMSLQAPLMAVGAISMALATAPSMAWIIGLVVSVLVVLIVVIIVVGMPKFRLTQQLNDKLNQVARENLTGLRVVRAFNNEDYEEKKFQRANTEVAKVNLFTSRLMVTMMPVVQFAISGAALLIVWVGANLVAESVIGLGEIVAFMQYATQVMMSFMFLAMAFILIPRALVSIKRVGEVLKTSPSIKFKDEPTKTADESGLEFHKVSFSYKNAEKPVLENVSFKAEKGKITAIIGSTGSGKSTIVNLIPRFYDVSEGEILLDGVNIKNFSKDDLMARIGLVPQKALLFSGTIESNIKYGAPNISDKQLREAARIAAASEFIEKLDKKYRSRVSQSGSNFSGGQKQRLSIARAIAKNPEVYVFDDSFSALDYKTDSQVRANLKEVTENSAVIIVAQRVSTIRHADQIIVLENGKTVGIGTHAELMKKCDVYKEIALSQLSEKELK
ncbi:MAG: ABC transporter ATP-binding protein/permease [Candidatus Nomurabacteria bacterium]|jgi:ATP-binding cassette subfamily B protein|nr:ABC transporter ATP-binding protein/permease [Candidatus Nomurabacteria bacterium]